RMVELLVSQRRFNEAFSYAERAKARVLIDSLQSGGDSISARMTSEEKEKELQLKASLATLNSKERDLKGQPKVDRVALTSLHPEIEKARINLEAFRNELYSNHPEIKKQRGEIDVVDDQQALRLLPRATLVLEYVVTDDATFVFALSREASDKLNIH